MQKKSSNPILKPKDITLDLVCEGCQHFNYIPRMVNKDNKLEVCSKLGVRENSSICKYYRPNPKKVDFKSKIYSELEYVLSNIDRQDLDILASIVLKEHDTRKRNLKYGQLVYFVPSGDDYLDNYKKAKVISADLEYCFVQGLEGYYGAILIKNIYTEKQFEKKRKELIKRKRVKDPNYEPKFVVAEIESLETIMKRVRKKLMSIR